MEIKAADTDIPMIRRIAAGVICLLMVFFIIFSVVFIIVEADHDCCGEGCAICTCIEQSENAIRSMRDAAVPEITEAICVLFCLAAVHLYTPVIREETPVSDKVRLNN